MVFEFGTIDKEDLLRILVFSFGTIDKEARTLDKEEHYGIRTIDKEVLHRRDSR
jgi:hypothetical protein